MHAGYNNIATWKFKDIVTVFGAGEHEAKKFQVRTKAELDTLLSDPSFGDARCLQFVELYMRKDDAPRALVMTAQASAKTNLEAE